MHDDLRAAVHDLFPELTATLGDLIRIPSVSAAGFPPDEVRRSAETIAAMLGQAGFSEVRLLELDGAHPAVYGHIPGPEGTPTVLLYAHHDVQPPGPPEEWERGPFEPFEAGGRLFGRGASDDKSGVIMHLGAVRTFAGSPPVGVKVIIEGEEEIGSAHLPDYLAAYRDLLAADVIVIADAGNWRCGEPALTTSLRGIVGCIVEVRTAARASHSGQFGGVFPDALTALCRLLASLHDDAGEVAVQGLVAADSAPLDLTVEELAEQMGVVPGLHQMGTGGITSRLWAKPAISVLAVDAPAIAEAINQLVPVARAKVSMRTAPGQDTDAALNALRAHLLDHAPWGSQVTVIGVEAGDAFTLPAAGPRVDAFRSAMREAWDVQPVDIGAGGSIPFVAAFSGEFPDADILLTGAGDPTSAIHAPNESQNLDDLERSILAEAIALRLLAEG